MSDYLKINFRNANRIKCKSCSSILRYNLNLFELCVFFVIGLFVAFLPGYYLWPPINLNKFYLYYGIIIVLLWLAVRYLEAWYVATFKKVQLIDERC